MNRLRKLRAGGAASLRGRVLMLASGAAFSQIIVVAASPIISRLYAPDDFGVTAGYAFLLNTLLAINSLRYEYAIPLPKDDDEALNLTGLTMGLVLLLSTLFTALIWALGVPIATLFNEPRIGMLLPLLPFGLIIVGFNMALNYWATRREQFETVSASHVLSNAGQTALQIAFGVAGFGLLGLGISYVIGQALMLLTLARVRFEWRKLRPRTWGALAVQHQNFPLYSMPSSLIDIFGAQLPAVLLLALFSAEEAGYFSLTMRILGLPVGIIGAAIAQTIYPALTARRDQPEETKQLFASMASALLMVSLTGFGAVLVTGGWLFTIVFGEQWATAGLYAQLLVPYFLVVFIASPLSALALVRGRQKEVLWLTTMVTILRFGALVVGGLLGSPALAIALFSLVSFIIFLIYLLWLFHLAHIRLVAWLRTVRAFLAVFVALVGVGMASAASLPPLVHLGVFAVGFGLFGLFGWRRYGTVLR
ncbi:MAG: oligosaccharide flippase family protein [Chloroflexota bacterium]|nr:oligosaccharide flippase family protein [Chloroflexota bacterium]